MLQYCHGYVVCIESVYALSYEKFTHVFMWYMVIYMCISGVFLLLQDENEVNKNSSFCYPNSRDMTFGELLEVFVYGFFAGFMGLGLLLIPLFLVLILGVIKRKFDRLLIRQKKLKINKEGKNHANS